MFFYIFIAFLGHACCSLACSNVFCIANENKTVETGYQQCKILQRLPDLTENMTGCMTVRIYLSSETHLLEENLTFSDLVNEINIHGVSEDQPSTIECESNTGIIFNENMTAKTLFLSNNYRTSTLP